MTHAVNTTTSGTVGNYGSWSPTAGVKIVCTNRLVGASGKTNAHWRGSTNGVSSGAAYGPRGALPGTLKAELGMGEEGTR